MNNRVSPADLSDHEPTVEERMAGVNDTTRSALVSTMLTPRFYTTDFEEMDKINVEPVRAEWDVLIAQMKSDPNRGHFKRNEDWEEIDEEA